MTLIALQLATLYGLVTSSAYVIAAFRLLCFPRNGARYRPLISLLATTLIGCLLTGALHILFYRPAVTLPEAFIAVLFCIMVIRAGGNLAALLRPSE